jgi:hypothetical protein
MTRLQIDDRAPARFEGDFTITPVGNVQPTAEELSYVAELENALARVVQETEADAEADIGAAATQERARIRRGFVDDLRTDATQVAAETLAAASAENNVLVRRGMYLADADRVLGTLFSIVEVFADSAYRVGESNAVDLDITVRSNLPKPNDTPTPEQRDLYVALNGALTVIKTVCQRVKKPRGRLAALFGWGEGDGHVRADQLLDEYVRKLAGIGRLGLVGSQTQLASLALNALREEFAAREAGRIKNGYIRSLGLACSVVGLAFLAPYVAIQAQWIVWEWGALHSPFLLAGAGAALGTWLSFSIRRVKLEFHQLGIIEEDLLDPSLRVLFVMGLTLAAFLLFWTGALSIEVGDLKVNATGFKQVGSSALLVGIFFGIAERALATAIGGRAEAFVGGIAGGR